MRLKKIQLQGFKSFADKTTLEFGKGVTAVVGPNGCGKSNIADAFRWVLGEQSARSMRGLKMQDVIFEGTSTRPALNFAEVTLTLTEINAALPIQYEEIAVTRRLFRSGESTYLLNGQTIRLKDLQDLFADSGIGKNAFIGKNSLSILEQGKIEQVINSTPLERRAIFWEAAGIIRFLQSKRDVKLKLDDAQENVARVKDIHHEVESQILILREQALKAADYKAKKAQLERLEKTILIKRWDDFSIKIAELLQKGESKQAQVDNALRAMGEFDQKIAMAKEALEKEELKYRQQSEGLFKVRSDKEIKAREMKFSEERLKELLSKEKGWDQEIADLCLGRQNESAALKASQQKLREMEKILADLETKRQQQKSHLLICEGKVSELREKVQLSHKENLDFVRQEAQLHSELKQSHIRQENSRERHAQQSARLVKLVQLEEEFTAQCQEKQHNLNEQTSAIDKQRELFQALEKKVDAQVAKIQQQQKQLDLLMRGLNEDKARCNVLTRLRKDMEGFSVAAKKLLQASNNVKSPLYGKLKGIYQEIPIDEGMQEAAAAALNPYEQTLLVETAEDFDMVLEFAKKEKLSDFSILCLDYFEEHSKNEIHSIIPDLGAALLSKKSRNRSPQRLLQNVYVVAEISKSWELINQNQQLSVYCPNVGFIDHQGVFFQRAKEKSSIFLQEAEIKMLELKLQALEQQRLAAEEQLAAEQSQRLSLHTELMESDKTVRRSEMRLIELNFALQRSNGELEKNRKEQSQVKEEVAQLAAAIALLAVSAAEAEKKHGEIQAKKEALEHSASAMQESHLCAISAAKAENENLQQHEIAFQKASKELQQLIHQINVAELKALENLRNEKRLSEEIRQARDLQQQLSKSTLQFEADLAQIERQLQSESSACKLLEEVITAAKKRLEAIEKEARSHRDLAKRQEGDRQSLALLLEQNQSAQKALEVELEGRYQQTMEQVRDQKMANDSSLEEAEKLVRSLRQALEMAGDINLTSIEECAKHQVRFDFLQKQMLDLENARDDLLAIISDLDAESIKIFRKSFNAICENFRKNFAILFNGGEADLQLTCNSDIIEAGIEIIARPPGKQMNSINLLSGGEKCLTAMALLFAIFETKAGPYCILDEIDAPLDDSNVDRFSNMLRQFVDRCQFIIITHNKRTMSIADRLYGVSMENRGVSKLLKMEFLQSESEADSKVLVEV